jgi:hypothetical protein
MTQPIGWMTWSGGSTPRPAHGTGGRPLPPYALIRRMKPFAPALAGLLLAASLACAPATPPAAAVPPAADLAARAQAALAQTSGTLRLPGPLDRPAPPLGRRPRQRVRRGGCL